MVETGYARVLGYASESASCILPRSLLARLGWRQGDIVNIAFGRASRPVKLRAGDDDVWRVSTDLLRHIGLRPRKWLYCVDTGRKLIRFGPLIGIMTTWHVTPYFRSVMRAAARKGMMAVVFRPYDLRLGGRQMSAWALVGGGMQRIRVPWPDVVYNRIPNRGGELLGSTRACRRLLARASIPVFNSKFFHKWRIHRLLRRDEQARQYLPETQPMVSMKQARQFLHKYPMIYLKPNGGSKGQGIVRIRRGQGYSVSFRRGHHNFQRTCTSWLEAGNLARRGMHRRTYVVQEGVPLARYHGRPFDVRVTLYKNGNGEWIPCGPAAKIAGRGSITTHVANGGRVVPLDRVLRHVFGSEAETMRVRIETASIDLARAVERVTGLELGELGLDIGLTTQGRVAMFEANSKPGRAIFAAAWNRDDRRKSLSYLCDYAASLAGFTNSGVKTDAKTANC
ncbi:MAG: YheC/YheD family protein [Firmicutes bacterium]|nr:YheC/YheD family protein [Bacillota bacterium]